MSRDARSEKTEPRTTVPGWGRRFGLDLLAVRVIAFLTIALLPIGVIAMLQSQKVREEVDGRSALTLLALTAEAATTERQVFQRAFGAAEALGIVEDLLVRRDDCYAYLSQFMRERGLYVFVGFVKPDGSVTCSTSRDPVAVAVTPQFIDLVQAP